VPAYSDEEKAAAKAKWDALVVRLRADAAKQATDPYALGADAQEALGDPDLAQALGYSTANELLQATAPDLDAALLNQSASVAARFSRDVVAQYGWPQCVLLHELVLQGAVTSLPDDPGNASIPVPKPDGTVHHLHFRSCSAADLQAALTWAKRPRPEPAPRSVPAPQPAPGATPSGLPASAVRFALSFALSTAGFALNGFLLGRIAEIAGTGFMALSLWQTPRPEIAQWAAWAQRRAGPFGGLAAWVLGALGSFKGVAVGGLIVGTATAAWQLWTASSHHSIQVNGPVLLEGARPRGASPPPLPPALNAPAASQTTSGTALPPEPPAGARPSEPPALTGATRRPAPAPARPAYLDGPRPLARTPESERVPQFDDPDVDPSAPRELPPPAPKRKRPPSGKDPDLEKMEKDEDPYAGPQRLEP
jgi:hypothetical protein